jgi:hypothetical protein
MSKWPMRGHFRYLRFKTFLMTQRILQCKVFWALLSNPKHSRVPEDSKSPTLGVLGFTPTLGQSGVATHTQTHNMDESIHKYPYTTTRPPSWRLGLSNFQVALYIFYMLYTFVGARIKRPSVMLSHR